MTPSGPHPPPLGFKFLDLLSRVSIWWRVGRHLKLKERWMSLSFTSFRFSFFPCACPFPLNDKVPSASFNTRANNDLSSLNFRWGDAI